MIAWLWVRRPTAGRDTLLQCYSAGIYNSRSAFDLMGAHRHEYVEIALAGIQDAADRVV